MKENNKITVSFVIACIIAKIVRLFIQGIKKGAGTNTPGNIALKICPDILKYFKLPGLVIAVTGSNGKTSTSNYINEILIKNGYKTINNSEGSNMPAGIAACIIANATIFGKCKDKEVAVFEVDERASALIYRHITPTHLVCTNLFRDSIYRNGHSEFILSKINEKLPKSTKLILNADDLISSNIGEADSSKTYFGLNKSKGERNKCENLVCDISVCPKCKNMLSFEYLHYNHIGKAYCSKCDFKSPVADYLATNIDMGKKTFEIKSKNNKLKYNFDFDTLFNVYNITAAITLCILIGIKEEKIKESIKELKVKSSRKDVVDAGGLRIVKMLSKNQNPISCSRTMDYVAKIKERKVVILAITDPNGDAKGSEDISWLYDTDIEYLKEKNIKQIIVLGKRAHDVVLRLLIAKISRNIISEREEYGGVEDLIKFDNIESIYVLHSLYAEQIAQSMIENIKKKVEEDNV